MQYQSYIKSICYTMESAYLDILSADVFTEKDRYRTKLEDQLLVNDKEYKALIIPYSQYITESLAKAVIELKKRAYPILFIDGFPTGIIDGDNELLTELSDCSVVTLDNLVFELKKHSVPEIVVEPPFSMLRYLHYREENDIYIFTNENITETFCGTVVVPKTGPVYAYDAGIMS